MKKVIIATCVVALSAALSSTAFAESRGMGCGLGYMVWKGQKGILPQTSAGTTNGTFYNQYFGMTVGTLGCSPDYTVMNNVETTLYAEVNFDQIKRDMARGEGEYLSTLASLVGVEEADRAAFYTLTRERYAALVGSAGITSTEFLNNLGRELAATPALARYVA
ncbi:MAG: DUF3015 domain-containing protein [Nitrospirota bacterium]|nr:DUF3015 domain-containing protein [Nitrospirota bacterium]